MSDLISRQAVLESLETDYSLIMFDSHGNLTFMGKRIIEAIKSVPSVEPERKPGKWIPCTKSGMPLTELGRREGGKWYGYKCSECNHIYKGNALTESPFCQKCGADMREVDG